MVAARASFQNNINRKIPVLPVFGSVFLLYAPANQIHKGSLSAINGHGKDEVLSSACGFRNI